MGKRGPVKAPTAILRLSGGHAEGMIAPPVGEPTCPDWLTDRAKEEWDHAAPLLLDLGVLARVDQAALAIYCQAVADVEELRTEIAEHGWIVPSKEGTKKNPLAQVYSDACSRVRAFSTEFGLTPSARTKIKIEEAKTADPLGAFNEEKKEPESEALSG